MEFGTQAEQCFQIGRVDEAVGGITGDGDALAGEQGRNGRWWCIFKNYWFWQVDPGASRCFYGRSTLTQCIGQAVEAAFQIVDFRRLQQAEVAFWQGGVRVARQGTEPAHTGRQAVTGHRGVAFAADPIGQHAGKGQAGAIGGEAVGDGAESLGHRPGIDHCHHRNVEATGDIGSRRRTVEQPHDAFEQNQVGIFGRASQPPARIFLAAHAEIKVLAGATTGDGVNLRIKKIRAAFENGDAPALASVQPGQCGGHGGFALTGGRRGNQEGGTGGHFSSLLAVGSIRTGLPVFRLRRFRCPIRHCASSG
jgi:hypothetical protein